jgi:hypothetical protein
MLHASAAAGGNHAQLVGVIFDQLGHKWTVLICKMAENPHFIGKSFFGFWSSERFVNPPVVGHADGGPQSVLHLAHRENQCSGRKKDKSSNRAAELLACWMNDL